MKPDRLHIVTFDVPYPPTYGGAIDVFYRIKALYQKGIRITLHCTYKGTLTHYPELESLCDCVYYYRRSMPMVRGLFSTLPIAVRGRCNDQILANLLRDDAPILYEGLVSCGTMANPRLSARTKYFRECNVEHDYYRGLAQAAHSWRKLYYMIEAHRLQTFERTLANASVIFTLAHQDELHFREAFPQVPTVYLPCFHSNTSIVTPRGIGSGILYHGNLDVPENRMALGYILEHIVPRMPDVPFVVAGRTNDQWLQKTGSPCSNVRFVPNPKEDEMQRLVQNAQIHLLLTFQNTGLKLKLLNVLYRGRYVVCNTFMANGSGLEALCHIADTPESIVRVCRDLLSRPLSESEIECRREVLADFDNEQLKNRLYASLR